MSNDNFVVTAHALERFQERFPALWENDHQAAHLIHEECEAALVEGRSSFVAPLELTKNDLDRWEAGKGLVVWTPGKARGYVLLESPGEGMLVTTVLVGKPSEEARRRLYRDERERRSSENSPNHAGGRETSLEAPSETSTQQPQPDAVPD